MKKYLLLFLDFFGLKLIVRKQYRWTKSKYVQLINNFFNKNAISQNKNYKSIPIIIISFNQLFYLKKLIDFLIESKYHNIVIIDNNSSYKPLLEYFNEISNQVKIHRLDENYGHLVFWEKKELFDMYSQGYYAVTDADVVPIEECPHDFIRTFKRLLENNLSLVKVGFSLKIDDIPATNFNKEKILKWESQFWISKIEEKIFRANIDTTFALYQPGYKYRPEKFRKAVRTDYPLQARHGGWYINSDNLSEEQKNYYENCNESSSWRINNCGDLKTKDY